MKISTTLFISTSILLLAACQKDQTDTAISQSQAPTTQAEISQAPITQANQTNRIYGKVTETLEASGYTYIQVDDGKTQTWAAGPTTSVNKGDMIAFDTGMAMRNFHSKAMNRDFEVLYFVDQFITDKPSTETSHDAMPEPHGQITQAELQQPISGIEKIKDGNSIAEILAHKQSLKDRNILVRGKVTKFTGGVLGKNWIHIRDSSTLDDITITTSSVVEAGDIVIAEGKLELDKDYGYGYVYAVIIEDAKVTKE
ncbi:MAG: hypothetical protein OEY89_03860 [Gammaproteobacteria bacterium]|nr:hypothetical protein [Gammaproteobacteria bacterium]